MLRARTEAGAEDEARVDIRRFGDDAVLEDVSHLVGQRLEHGLVDFFDRSWSVLDDDRLASFREALERRGEGNRSGQALHAACGVRGSRPWAPPGWSSTDGAIGRPSRRTASSVSSTSCRRSSTLVMIEP